MQEGKKLVKFGYIPLDSSGGSYGAGYTTPTGMLPTYTPIPDSVPQVNIPLSQPYAASPGSIVSPGAMVAPIPVQGGTLPLPGSGVDATLPAPAPATTSKVPWLLLGGAGLLLLLMNQSKGKKVGALPSWVLPVGGLAALYFLTKKPGGSAAATFNAQQIIGKNLTGLKPVPVYVILQNYYAGLPPDYTVPAGESVGVVYSWIQSDLSHGDLWWEFYDAYGTPYYVKHEINLFDIASLTAQGAQNTTEQTAAETAKANDLLGIHQFLQSLLPDVNLPSGTTLALWIVGGIVAVVAVKQIIKKEL